MPIIERIETDMFRFADVCRHMVCPVPTSFHVTGGLIEAFIKKDAAIKDAYRELCDANSLVVGKPICQRTNRMLLWDTIFFPMKVYAEDTAVYKDVRKNIEELRKFLQKPIHKHTVVGIPMLGCEGGGPDPYNRVREMMTLYLDNLPATVFLSMSPSKVSDHPKYLVIVGPKGLTKTEEGKARIEKGIQAVLSRWDLSIPDFTAVVTGSETTLDKFFTGPLEGGPEADTCFAKRYGAKRFFPIAINWEEDKTLALTRHRTLLTEIGTHFILIMPDGMNNNRAVYINAYLKEANQKLATLGKPEKKVFVIGKSTTDLKDESPLNIE